MALGIEPAKLRVLASRQYYKASAAWEEHERHRLSEAVERYCGPDMTRAVDRNCLPLIAALDESPKGVAATAGDVDRA
jgi:hypothetical protein